MNIYELCQRIDTEQNPIFKSALEDFLAERIALAKTKQETKRALKRLQEAARNVPIYH